MEPVRIELEEVLNEVQRTPEGKLLVELAVERVLNRQLRARLEELENDATPPNEGDETG